MGYQKSNETTEGKKAFSKALKYLAIKPRSRKELNDKLKDKKFSLEVVENILKKIDELGYLNDEDFAKSFLELKKSMGKGKIFIARELKRKGVDEEIIKGVLSRFYSETDEHEIAKTLAQKKFPNYPELKPRETIKLKNLLFQRGFSWEIIDKFLTFKN